MAGAKVEQAPLPVPEIERFFEKFFEINQALDSLPPQFSLVQKRKTTHFQNAAQETIDLLEKTGINLNSHQGLTPKGRVNDALYCQAYQAKQGPINLHPDYGLLAIRFGHVKIASILVWEHFERERIPKEERKPWQTGFNQLALEVFDQELERIISPSNTHVDLKNKARIIRSGLIFAEKLLKSAKSLGPLRDQYFWQAQYFLAVIQPTMRELEDLSDQPFPLEVKLEDLQTRLMALKATNT